MGPSAHLPLPKDTCPKALRTHILRLLGHFEPYRVEEFGLGLFVNDSGTSDV